MSAAANESAAAEKPSVELVTITVDGKTVQVPKGMLLVEAARQAGVEIPVFCYHPKLDPAGVCRMCLVQIEKTPKPVTACTTPVVDGMVVHTQNELVGDLRKGVLEFLLINHPLDCPVCDKGGECDLQDLTFGYGPSTSRLADGKVRKNKAVDLGPFIVLDEERCILCRRCTRFDDEIACEGNLIIAERGHENVVTTNAGHPYDSYFSGNTIELCPVGALTSDLYRFKARPWDLSRIEGVCTGCSVGCNVTYDYRHGRLVRLVARDNPEVDGGWICDRGRFNYNYINTGDRPDAPSETVRLTAPLVRRGDRLVPVSWQEALTEAARRLRDIKSQHGPDAIGVIGGGRLTNEEAYLLQKFARAVLGTNNVDYRAGAQYVASSASFPGSLTDLDDASAILLVDVDAGERAPVMDLRIRRAMERKGARVVAIGSAMPVYRARHARVQVLPGQTAGALEAIAASLTAGAASLAASQAADPSAADATARATAQRGDAPISVETAREVARILDGARKVVVVWSGENPAAGKAIHALLTALQSDARSAHLLIASEQANSRGAEWMGVLPTHLPGFVPLSDETGRARFAVSWGATLSPKPGKPTGEMLAAAASGELKALYVAGANIVMTGPDGNLTRRALSNSLVIAQELFLTETAKYADIVFPAAPFTAKPGTFTNLDGHVQGAAAAMEPGEQSLPDSLILDAVGAALGGNLIRSPKELQWELEHLVGHRTPPAGQSAEKRAPGAPDELLLSPAWTAYEPVSANSADTLVLVAVDRLIAGGGTTHFDEGLKDSRPLPFARFHPADAAAHGVEDGEPVRLSVGERSLVLVGEVSFAVTPGTVQVPKGLPEAPANLLGVSGTPVSVSMAALVREVG